MNKILPKIFATLTGHPRQIVSVGVDFQWSSKSWTHNAFRLWELLFGRRYGKNGVGDTIRAEMTTYIDNVEGRAYVKCHSVESIFAFVETTIRGLLTIPRFKIVKIYLPRFAPVGFGGFSPSPYLLAIAFDAANGAIVNPGTSVSFSHTYTGSNLVGFYGSCCNGGDHVTGVTSNSVSATLLDNTITTTSGNIYTHLLINPSTGVQTDALTSDSTSTFYSLIGASYSGVSQTSVSVATDTANHGSSVSTTGTSWTVVRTSNANNCWHLNYHRDFNGPSAVGANTTDRNDQQSVDQMVSDNNAAITPAGSNTLNYTTANVAERRNNDTMLAPVAAAAAVLPFRALLGVGI